MQYSYFSRRHFLRGLAAGIAVAALPGCVRSGPGLGVNRTAAAATRPASPNGLTPEELSQPGRLAEELVLTPRQTEGPFFPDRLPLDTDNDLIIINNSITPAVGKITHLTGKVTDIQGRPFRNTLIEIWQVDNEAIYLHTGGGDRNRMDKNFQGYGRFLTGSTGEYRFRTIQPVPYPGRTPHIHLAVKAPNQAAFTTQCYIKGHPQNETDSVLRGIRDPKARASVIVDFVPVKDSRIGELAANFNLVMGFTPEL